MLALLVIEINFWERQEGWMVSCILYDCWWPCHSGVFAVIGSGLGSTWGGCMMSERKQVAVQGL